MPATKQELAERLHGLFELVGDPEYSGMPHDTAVDLYNQLVAVAKVLPNVNPGNENHLMQVEQKLDAVEVELSCFM